MTAEFILRGGLGNQLFILLEAYKVLLSRNDLVLLNLAEYSRGGRPDRSFSIPQLLPDLFSAFGIAEGFLAEQRYYLCKGLSKFRSNISSDIRLPGDTPMRIKFPNSSILHFGYFQFIDDTTLTLSALERFRALIAGRLDFRESTRLAVHVRRGDYLLPKHKLHGLIREEDQLIEVNRLMMTGKFEGITIFTDSPDLVNISVFKQYCKNVNVDPGGRPHEVLVRMASHGGIVASNSSFSLWAGLLSGDSCFSLPDYWMPGIKSDRLGLSWVRRFGCTL